MDHQRLRRPRRHCRDRPARRDHRRPARTSCPACPACWRIAGLDELAAAGAGVTDDQLRQRRDQPPRRRPGHDHLHLRHHRAPQGLRADAPQPARRGSQRRARRAARGLRDRRRQHAALHAAGARVRQDHRDRLPGVRRHARALGGHGHRRRGAARIPADVPARRSARVREGLQHRAAAGLGEPGQEQDLRRGRQRRHRLQPGSSTPAGPAIGLRLRHALFDRLVYGKLRAAVGGRVTLRRLRRCAARRAARPLLPRRRHHRARGLRHDRDLGRGDRQQAEPQQGRHGRPAAAGRQRQDRRRRRDPAPRRHQSSRATGRTRPPPRKPWTTRAGCTPAISARSTTRASCGSPAGRRS